MEQPTIFHLLAEIFAEEKVSAVLIGGFAVNYYKVTRHTADIDFLITREDFEKIVSLLERKGFKKDHFQEVFARLSASKDYLLDVDFMFVDKETLNKIIKQAKQIYIARAKFIIPSLLHLIALKLHAIKYNPSIREYKDLGDIFELVKVNKVDVKNADFKELCLKYGNLELYEKIVARA